MNEVKKSKGDNKHADKPVKESPAKKKDVSSNKNTKGKSNNNVPSSPTTEVNPAG